MKLARRCRPSLAATTLLTALMLGACSYSPERSLTVSGSASPAGEKQAATNTAARADSRSKAQGSKSQGRVARAETAKPAGTSRRVAASEAAEQTTSSRQAPRRQVVASNSERDCLVRAMYFESQRSSREGLLAVGTVVMNRVNSPSYPSTICGVVGQKRQFAAGVLSRPMAARERHHADAVADEVLAGKRHTSIGDAMFFHVASRRYSYPNMRYLQVAGGNIFYRKVGRNAPRVVEGSALAYASTTPAVPTLRVAQEAPVTVALAVPSEPEIIKPAPDLTTATAAVTTAPAAIAAAAPVPAPLPVPRTALAAAPSEATVQPAAGGLSLLPAANAFSSSRPGTTEPSTLLSYRAIGPSLPAE